jgi:hypothetical protein
MGELIIADIISVVGLILCFPIGLTWRTFRRVRRSLARQGEVEKVISWELRDYWFCGHEGQH